MANEEAATVSKKHRTEPAKKDGVSSEAAQKYTNVVDELWEWDGKIKMFHEPVSDADVAGYSSVIKHPIALSDIRRRIQKGKYTSDEKFENDLVRMVGNALEFNAEGSPFHKHALRLRRQMKKVLVKHGVAQPLQGEDADDEVFVPTHQAVDNCKTFNKEMKKNREDIGAVLSKMEKDMDIPIEELRARYTAKKNINEPAKEGEETAAEEEKKRGREDDEKPHQEEDEGSSVSSSSDESSDAEDDTGSSDEDEDADEDAFEDSTSASEQGDN